MIMQRTLFASLCFSLLLVGNASGAEYDPFAVLFGDVTIDASRDDQASADNALILNFKLRNYLIDDSWVAYETKEGICLPIKLFTESLKLPFKYEQDSARGWVFQETEPVYLVFTEANGFKNTPIGWCARIETIEGLFPLTISYSPSRLELIVESTDIFPMEAKLERDAIRELFDDQTAVKPSKYRMVDNPYQWLSWPSMDFSINNQFSTQGGNNVSLGIDLTADFFKTTGHLTTVVAENFSADSTRLSLVRDNVGTQLTTPQNAMRISMGDISSSSLPLAKKSSTGSGFTLSNIPLYKSDMFDKTVIRGNLREGWEAELYNGSILLDYITKPNKNGEYEFFDVSLSMGYNRLTVKLFGPHGQSEEHDYVQFVGAELIPKNAFRYNLGSIDPNRSLFGAELSRRENSGSSELPQALGRHDFASFEYGLGNARSIRTDFLFGEYQSINGLSFFSSVLDGYGVVRVAHDQSGNMAKQLQFQRPLASRSTLSFSATDYGEMRTGLNGYTSGRTGKSLNVRLNTFLDLLTSPISLRGELTRLFTEDGNQQLLGKARLSGTTRVLKWANSFQYIGSNVAETELTGNLLLSKKLKGVSWRSTFGYQIKQKAALRNFSLSAKKTFTGQLNAQGAFSYDFVTNTTTLQSSLSRLFGPVRGSTFARFSENNDWTIGFELSGAWFRDPVQERIKLAQHGVTGSGIISPRVFDDINSNGQYDDDDILISGAELIVDGSSVSAVSDEYGFTHIYGLETGRILDAQLNLKSIDDPFLWPLEKGRSMLLRPGQPLNFDVPLTIQGDAEGVLLIRDGEITTSLAGITIEAFDGNGLMIATTKTAYDGYFYFSHLPTETVTLKTKKKQITQIGKTATSVTIELSRQNSSAFDISLFIDK